MLQQLEARATRKENQKDLMKASKHVTATKINECVFLEMLTIKKPNNGKKVTLTKKYWRIIVDELIRMKFSNLYYTKNGMIEPTYKRFKKW